MRHNDALRIHALLEHSRANGPDLRAVLWTQGCTLGCPGCFNPQTHLKGEGELVSVAVLFERIAAIPGIEGLTISGGEPLQQITPLAELLRRLRQATPLSVIVFTGFDMEEIQRLPGSAVLLDYVDVLITGRYRQEQRLARGLRGSGNKQLYFLTRRYQPWDFENLPEAEVVIDPGGQVTFSGIDPLAPI